MQPGRHIVGRNAAYRVDAGALGQHGQQGFDDGGGGEFGGENLQAVGAVFQGCEGFGRGQHAGQADEAEELCDRIAIINHGQLIANKPTRELVDMAREKVVVLTFDSGVPELPRSPAFLKCERVGERTIEITYDKDSSNAGEVLALVQGQGFGIVDVTTREADLEDVFVRLTSQAAA